MTYEILIRQEGQRYVAICRQIPGLAAAGKTAGAALDAIQQLLSARLTQRGASPPVIVEVHATIRSNSRLA
ncbi:MAG: hypothetical protein KatS3mg057_1364 [Herpetosiphonaceae bacterium]|nr:MAG: hypothetical protein KatS3mg057_1364 [Herpetosiphonaceae bacterium]